MSNLKLACRMTITNYNVYKMTLFWWEGSPSFEFRLSSPSSLIDNIHICSYVVCDLGPDTWCEALSSVSSALVALREQSEGSTSSWFFWRFFTFSFLIFQQHWDNFSSHFRRIWELPWELIKSKTRLEIALNKLKPVKIDFVSISSQNLRSLSFVYLH